MSRQVLAGLQGGQRRSFAIATLVTLLGLVGAFGQWATVDLGTADIFLHQFVVFELPGGLLMLVLLGVAAFLAPRVEAAPLARLARALARQPWRSGLVVAALLAAGTHVVYHDHPLSMDEYLVWFQSRVFAAGRLTGELPPPLVPWLIPRFFVGKFFDVGIVTGRVVPVHWPGFALLTTPFTWLGAPWLANPVLAGLGIVLLAHVARQVLADEEAAGWAMALAVASPAFVINALSYYSMGAHLVANLAYTALLLRVTSARLVAAGLVGSIGLVLNQPLPHLLFALPWIAWLAWRPGRVRNLALLALGYLPLTLLLGVGWLKLRSVVRLEALAAPGNAAAAAEPLWRQALAMLDAVFDPPSLELASYRLMGYVKVWNWAAPALPLLAWLGWRACRRRPAVGRIAASALLTLAGYWLTHSRMSQGHGWGFRYFHSAWWVLPLFAAALVATAAERERWTRLLGTVALLGLLVSVPFFSVQVERFIARHLAQDFAEGDAGAEIHLLRIERGYYVQDLVQNDPFLRDRVLRLRSLGPERDHEMLERAFPGARRVRADERGEVWVLDASPQAPP